MTSSLDGVRTLSDLSTYVEDLEVKEIGVLGGRRFTHGDEDFSLNDIIRKFETLNNKQIGDSEHVRQIRKKIKLIDKLSTAELKKSNIITRFFTFVRSYLNPIHKSKTQDEVLREIGMTLPPKEKTKYLFEQIFDEKAKVGLIPLELEQNDNSVLAHLMYAILRYADNSNQDNKIEVKNRMSLLVEGFEGLDKEIVSSLLYNLATDKEAEALKPYFIITLTAYARCKDDWEDLELRDYKTGKTIKITEEMKTQVRNSL